MFQEKKFYLSTFFGYTKGDLRYKKTASKYRKMTLLNCSKKSFANPKLALAKQISKMLSKPTSLFPNIQCCLGRGNSCLDVHMRHGLGAQHGPIPHHHTAHSCFGTMLKGQ